ncbi:YkgJ family cysteine cluster protein [Paludibacterium denitrificans]|uniref:YkgJ family cysteine cluster protein n=1 Tax=Paludibacterium denitrificans TaxID=2675226 RepID=A0A844GFY4_9NEIS|nr:YkgJ family cysteine cluster protein [Paludibacterium denitrificans]MTD34191.1 hypothetical protein [Paludibacterium denitrificans]
MNELIRTAKQPPCDEVSQEPLAQRNIQTAKANSEKFPAAIPAKIKQREDTIQRQLSLENASAFSKLRKLYHLLNELGAIAAPYIACGKGCSACCHMNVMVSQLEVALIEKEVGARPAPLQGSRVHNLETFNGVPCPFLTDGACSIYEVRPFACRKHMNFDSSAYWCAPDRSHKVEMPLVEYSSAESAYLGLTRIWGNGCFADIRDFFPLTVQS